MQQQQKRREKERKKAHSSKNVDHCNAHLLNNQTRQNKICVRLRLRSHNSRINITHTSLHLKCYCSIIKIAMKITRRNQCIEACTIAHTLRAALSRGIMDKRHANARASRAHTKRHTFIDNWN